MFVKFQKLWHPRLHYGIWSASALAYATPLSFIFTYLLLLTCAYLLSQNISNIHYVSLALKLQFLLCCVTKLHAMVISCYPFSIHNLTLSSTFLWSLHWISSPWPNAALFIMHCLLPRRVTAGCRLPVISVDWLHLQYSAVARSHMCRLVRHKTQSVCKQFSKDHAQRCMANSRCHASVRSFFGLQLPPHWLYSNSIHSFLSSFIHPFIHTYTMRMCYVQQMVVPNFYNHQFKCNVT